MTEVKTGQTYGHYKGHEYVVLGLTRHSETQETLVRYARTDDPRVEWSRPLAMWTEHVESPEHDWSGPRFVLQSERPHGRIRTRSGRAVDIINPNLDDILIEDIAWHLSQLVRFCGAVDGYTVAQHSVLVSSHVPEEYALEGLLHDMAEAYINDVCRPLKMQVEMQGYKHLESAFESKIHVKFGLSQDQPAAVKVIDDRMAATEIRDLFADWEPRCGVEPLDITISPWSAELARCKFAERYVELTGEDFNYDLWYPVRFGDGR